MNCQHARNAILLGQSGELSSREQPRLQAHLDECAACRAYRADLSTLLSATRDAPLDREVNEFTVRRILSTAERAQACPSRQRIPEGSFLHLWRPALASGIAAVLLILFGIRFADRSTIPVADAPPLAAVATGDEVDLLAWDPDLEEDLERIENLLALAGDETSSTDTADSLDQLAEELIALESWNI